LQASVDGPSPANLSGKSAVPVLGAFSRDNKGAGGKGLRSFTFQLNSSLVEHTRAPYTP
jgi:hypothetical protein